MQKLSKSNVYWKPRFFTCVVLLSFVTASSSVCADTLLPPSSICVDDQCITTVDSAGNSSELQQDGVFPNTNIRHVPAIGVRAGTTRWTGDPNWFDNHYDATGLRYVHDNAPLAFKDVKTLLLMKIRLVDFYVDQNVAPANSAQAQDPNWSNYSWNGPRGDWISQQLQNSRIQSGEAALGLLVADMASSDHFTHPNWLLDPRYSWVESAGVERTRLDVPAARQHLIDFYTALVKKYGNSNLWAIVLGEYYVGARSQFPEGFSRAAYMAGRVAVWRALAEAAPLDANGNRIALYQTNPIFNSGVEVADLLDLGIGISQSDVRMFGFEHDIVSAQGKVPTMINGDSRLIEDEVLVRWPSPAPRNPFGFSGGERELPTPQQLAWFGSSRGPAPLTSMVLRLNESTVQNRENYAEALRMFGDGGSQGGAYGTFPAR